MSPQEGIFSAWETIDGHAWEPYSQINSKAYEVGGVDFGFAISYSLQLIGKIILSPK
jgi:hypothetical protein